MKTYNVAFVLSYCVVSTTITEESEEGLIDKAVAIIEEELGITIPANCGVEVEEIN
jgi:hypothetical protein